MNNIFKLDSPTSATVRVIETGRKISAVLGDLLITIDEKMMVEGSVTIEQSVGKKITDTTSRNPKPLFDISFTQDEEHYKVEGCIGRSQNNIYLGTKLTSVVAFEQECVKGKWDKSETKFHAKDAPFTIKTSEEAFVTMSSEQPEDPVYGDMYYSTDRNCIRMFGSAGWGDVKHISIGTKAPLIEKTKRLLIPKQIAVFKCKPYQQRWIRDTEKRRAKKVLRVKKRKLG